MERDKDHIEAKEQEQFSGAYIRSLVKHLTSKDSSDGSENGECFNDVSNKIPKQPPRQHKKQVRRRLHTTKPYQERLLNMAEARREIATALKFHRASMKQQEAAVAAAGKKSFDQEKNPKSSPIHSLYHPTANSYWPMSTFAPPLPLPPPSYHNNHNLVLPSQPLGLNLNFHSFTNLDTDIYYKPFSVYSSSSTSKSTSTPSSSSSISLSAPTGNPTDLHHIMDGHVMKEIRSLGYQQPNEWNDRMNLVASERWCNFMKTVKMEDEYDHGFYQFDQNMEFPPWLINEQHLDDHFSEAYIQDPALPRMDIGEIEAIEGEWLA